MAKKKSAGNKKAKQGRPSWMSDAVFELSQSFPRLVEHFNGNEQTPCIDCNLVNFESPIGEPYPVTLLK